MSEKKVVAKAKAKAKPKTFTLRVVMAKGTFLLLSGMADAEYRTPAQQVIALIHQRGAVGEAWWARKSTPENDAFQRWLREQEDKKLAERLVESRPTQPPPVPTYFVPAGYTQLDAAPAEPIVHCKLLGVEGDGGSWEENGKAAATVYRCEAEMADYFLKTEKYADFKPLGQFEQYVYFKTA